MLTRRELVPDAPGGNFEKFSVFFDLPVSTYAFQLRVKGAMDTLQSHGLPEFCDWDFCRDGGREPSRSRFSTWTRRSAGSRRYRTNVTWGSLIAVPSTWTRRAGRWVAAMAPSARRRPRTSLRAGS